MYGLEKCVDRTKIKERILVVEDDEMLSLFLERLLQGEGYEVELVRDGSSALKTVNEAHALVILDLNLPDVDGISLLQQLRPGLPRLPVLVLTARNRDQGVLPALDGGADDCLTKPFSYRELLARMRTLLRRNQPPMVVVSRCADLCLHREQMSVTRGERRIELTQREFALLEYLMRTPQVPVSRTVLLKEVWGGIGEASPNAVDVYLKYLRDKIDLPGLPRLIRTVRGTGYMVSAS